MENGSTSACGTFDEIRNSGKEFASLFKSQIDEDNNEQTENQITNKSDYYCPPEDEEPFKRKEMRETGSIAGRVYKAYFKAGGGWCCFLFVLLLFVLAQVASSAADYFIKFW